MTENVKAVSVKCFELFTEQGASLGLFKVKDQWRGICELVAVDDERKTALVLEQERDSIDKAFKSIFGDVFGEYRTSIQMVKVSPAFVEAFIATAAKR